MIAEVMTGIHDLAGGGELRSAEAAVGVAAVPPAGFLRPRDVEWGAVDWSLQNCVLADELGVSDGFITRHRKRLGKARPKNHCRWRERVSDSYRAWDWTKRDTDLAALHGFTRQYVSYLRKRFGLARSRFHKRKVVIEWTAVDWTLQNCVLADELGVDADLVRQERKRLGQPAALSRRWRRRPNDRYLSLDWSKRDCDLARETGLAATTLGQLRKRVEGNAEGRGRGAE